MFDILIHNVDVLRVAPAVPGGEPAAVSILPGQDIAIVGHTIALVAAASPERRQQARRLIDGAGMLAMAGLINTHCHSPMVLFRGVAEDMPITRWFNDTIWPMEANVTAEDVYWGALLGMAEMIRNGITTVADRYAFPAQIAAAVAQSGMRANLVHTFFDNQGQEGLARSRAFIEEWQGGADGRITAWVGPHADYTVSPPYLRACVQQARELNAGIHIHISERQAQVERSLRLHGLSPVQLLHENGVFDVPTLLGHCKFPTEADFPILAAANTGIAQAPKTYLRYPGGDPGAFSAAPILRFRELGIAVGLATDGAASNSTLDIFEAMRLLAVSVKGQHADATVMPVAEVLDIAFNGGAAVMQMQQQIGRLEPGLRADITLLRQDAPHMFPPTNVPANVVYNATGADVDTVLCDGKILLQKGQLQTIDLAEVRAQIKTRLPRLLQTQSHPPVAQYPD